tara:strand:+ start:326 stop:532 length:207 start_codon:yes stop_codon:yes gene_type:complete
MKNIIFIILSFFLLLSCSSDNESKKLDIQKMQLAHSKFMNLNNNLSYEEYKSLLVDYGKNGKFPDISK